FFFFQAEDGIRDATVTGVQTCALPILVAPHVTIRAGVHHRPDRTGDRGARRQHMWTLERETRGTVVKLSIAPKDRVVAAQTHGRDRKSRRVGKECRSGWDTQTYSQPCS